MPSTEINIAGWLLKCVAKAIDKEDKVKIERSCWLKRETEEEKDGLTVVTSFVYQKYLLPPIESLRFFFNFFMSIALTIIPMTNRGLSSQFFHGAYRWIKSHFWNSRKVQVSPLNLVQFLDPLSYWCKRTKNASNNGWRHPGATFEGSNKSA